MKIAFVVYGSLENISGGFLYDRALATALAAAGHRIDVIGLPWRGYLRAAAGGLLAPAARTRDGDGDGRSGRYDAIIVDELVHPSVLRRLPGAGDDTPIAALVHNLACHQPGARLRPLKVRLERRFLTRVDGVIAVCGRTLADVRALANGALDRRAEAGGGPPGATRPTLIAHPGRDHVTPGVDERLVDQRAGAPGPLRILHAAAIVPAKGLDRLLEALGALAARDPARAFTLDVVGDAPDARYARAIDRQVQRLDLAARVHLHGQRRGAELHALFRGSHVLALPSDREAYSLSCLEALGYGLAVLATSSGGLDEMITPDREGALLDPDDRAAWSAALQRLAGDRATLAARGRAALARYRAHATWGQVALNVQGFLETLRSRRRRAAPR